MRRARSPPREDPGRWGAQRWPAPHSGTSRGACGGDREGPFVCDACAREGANPAAAPPRGLREGRGEVTPALPLKRFNLRRYLHCFSTSGDRRKNGALSEGPSEFRFWHPRVEAPAASPVGGPGSARRAPSVRRFTGRERVPALPPQPAQAFLPESRFPSGPGSRGAPRAAGRERARQGAAGCPLLRHRLPDGHRPRPPRQPGRGYFYAHVEHVSLLNRCLTHKRLKKRSHGS